MSNRNDGYNTSRNINTAKATHGTNPHAAGYKGNPGPQPQRQQSRGSKRKKSKARGCLVATLCIMLAVLVPLGGIYMWVSSNINSGEDGSIREEIKTAPEFKGDVVNILVAGIDYEEGRQAKLTDMIMYVHFDVKNNTFNMFQIPRDTFVGEDLSTGKTGKVNALYWNAPDKDNRMGALTDAIADQFKLPIDYYATIEMESMKQIVDTIGGIDVYVPRDMEYNGSKLEKGMRRLDGASAEFFVRNRHGSGFERADIDRLEMQRYFYSALFRSLRTLTVGDLMKLMPVLLYNIKTDMSPEICMGLGAKLLKVPSSNIMMCRMPIFAAAEKYNNLSIVVAAPNEIAEVLNTYFRTYTEPVPAESLNLAPWPTTGSVIDAAVQYMGEIDADGGAPAA
ncbi:MAG: LCP family protein [Oscillospiraceae bacterium]